MADMNASLTIKIEYKEYISLSEFKESLEGLDNQYNALFSKSGDEEKNDRLLIKEINKGSIIVELVSALVPLLSDANTVIVFYTSIKSIFGWLATKIGAKPKMTPNDIVNAKKIIAPVNNHNGSQVTFSIEGDNNKVFVVDYLTARKITQNANEEYSVLDKPALLPDESEDKENVVLRLTQIKNDENPDKNTKGIIDELDKREHPILFSKVTDKEQILQEKDNFFKKTYLVNIKIHTSNDKISSYTVLDLKDSYTTEEDATPDLFS
jgi:hypothetical protein